MWKPFVSSMWVVSCPSIHKYRKCGLSRRWRINFPGATMSFYDSHQVLISVSWRSLSTTHAITTCAVRVRISWVIVACDFSSMLKETMPCTMRPWWLQNVPRGRITPSLQWNGSTVPMSKGALSNTVQRGLIPSAVSDSCAMWPWPVDLCSTPL